VSAKSVSERNPRREAVRKFASGAISGIALPIDSFRKNSGAANWDCLRHRCKLPPEHRYDAHDRSHRDIRSYPIRQNLPTMLLL